jgi:hypothetical protein
MSRDICPLCAELTHRLPLQNPPTVLCQRADEWSLLQRAAFIEVILVDLLEFVSLGDLNAHVVLDHQIDEAGSIDQDDLRRDLADILMSRRGEVRCGDEDPFAGSESFKTASERLNDFPPDRSLLTFGLHVDDIQTELVLRDGAVDSTVTRFADEAACICA